MQDQAGRDFVAMGGESGQIEGDPGEMTMKETQKEGRVFYEKRMGKWMSTRII